MFDFENPFKVAADIATAAESVEELTACDHETADAEPDWENADWEDITDVHAAEAESTDCLDAGQYPEDASARIYRKIHAHRKSRTAIDAARFAALAIGLSAIAWFARELTGLAIILSAIALVFGLIAAYGAGKYREM